MSNIRFAHSSASDSGHSALVVISSQFSDESQLLSESFDDEFKTFVLTSLLPSVDSVFDFVRELSDGFVREQIKRCTLFGIGDGGSIAQAFAAMSQKTIRRLVLLDATRRIAPGMGMRAIDRLEQFLPLGLPLKRLSKSFDSRPILHRIYCPTLVILSPTASEYVKQESTFIAKKIPNAWLRTLEHNPVHGEKLSHELKSLVQTFMQVPTKRPQRHK